MNKREIIQALGGPTKLAAITGIPKRTIAAHSNPGERRELSAPTEMLFKILYVLQQDGILENVIDRIKIFTDAKVSTCSIAPLTKEATAQLALEISERLWKEKKISYNWDTKKDVAWLAQVIYKGKMPEE